ncbi:MAG: hypothetical protein ACRD2I_07860 [Vicinamibacterales bacterium]
MATISCGAPLMKLPVGPGTPATDAVEALTQATMACRGIRTLTAEVAASGKVNGQRFRVRLSVGVAAPASARIEAVAPFGAPFFILASQDDDTTLLLPRDDRVLQHGHSGEVLDAVAGVPLDAAAFRTLLTGCLPEGTAGGTLTEAGPQWRMLRAIRGDGRVDIYLHRAGGASQSWQVAAMVRTRVEDINGGSLRPNAAWLAEYRDRANGLPRSVRLVSVDENGRPNNAFDLTLALSQVETNVPLGADVFHVNVPRTARPITLDELRHARPGVREN